ncbi:hypothetical protein NSK_007989 [Nannochloropsis salina CCMP1776]|uniref:Uncharacterized protein n=1 Tax=Nannochloropsis salina CCMP1776 TaxID=1027361 RepID=A0A4D9CNS6_9STRA|nr:hypothetical protein NSK_007989 [Nannochloropsis salina CCMP1776]|eukprot:TFJ80812.1 hypothetical protein NSK_007989 [Nannochloropsis salina CCMP1776]
MPGNLAFRRADVLSISSYQGAWIFGVGEEGREGWKGASEADAGGTRGGREAAEEEIEIDRRRRTGNVSLCGEMVIGFFPSWGTFDGYETFLKENKPLRETHNFKFGALDGELLDTAGVEKISKLPGKLELYTKLAFALKQPSTRLAKTLKAAPTKLTRAIKLSFEEGKEDGEEAAAPAEEPAAE